MRHKNRFSWYFTVCLLLLCCITTIAEALSGLDRGLNSRVFIETDVGRGSGFFVGTNQVVTCYHIIAGASSGQVATKSKYFNIVRVTEYNSQWDLAILRVEEDQSSRHFGKSPSSVSIGKMPSEGEKVYIIGSARGGELLSGSGQISNSNDVCGQHEFNIIAKTDPGCNGAPVLNQNGEVIGIATRDFLYSSAVRADYLNRLSPWTGQGAYPPLNVYNLDPCVLISLVNMKIEMGAHDSAIEYVRIFDDDRLDPLKKQQLKHQIRRAVQKGGKLTKMQRLKLLAKWLGIVF